MSEDTELKPEDPMSTPVQIEVRDAMVIVRTIDRFAESGSMKGPEILPCGVLRQKVTDLLHKNGIKYDDLEKK